MQKIAYLYINRKTQKIDKTESFSYPIERGGTPLGFRTRDVVTPSQSGLSRGITWCQDTVLQGR